MKFRINEGKELLGKSEAYYFIGVDDNGYTGYLDEKTMNDSLNTLYNIATSLRFIVDSIEVHKANNNKFFALCKIIKVGVSVETVRVCFVGPPFSGKTSIISSLCYGEKDNGNGSSRKSVLKHSHEIESGVTSSIKHEIIGFCPDRVNNYRSGIFCTWDKIVEGSDKIVELVDLPGDPKYYKTMYYGLLSRKPDFVIIITDDRVEDVEDYVVLMNKLNIGYSVVRTKSDIQTDPNPNPNSKIGVLSVSNVSFEGINDMYEILHSVKKIERPDNENVDFMINEVFNVPDRDVIVSGYCCSGRIRVNDTLLIGPINGEYVDVCIKSIFKKYVDHQQIKCGESGSLELSLMVK